MSKVLFGFMLLLIVWGGIGCGQNSTPEERQKPVPVEVSLTIMPESVKEKQPVKISARITQKQRPVNDAEDVKFEIGQENQEKKQMIAAKKTGDGVYSITYTFDKAGQYYIMYHVNAGGMHNMNKVPVNVQPMSGAVQR
ncbi:MULTISPECIES: FixH family protein [Aneurinibacillus]|uniref:FixH family protein n=1 Tax=Aneurinibacillus thermoaerophilus TaxID=143495 RepID=A0A1G8BJG2_ANETH|nr:MULTISPECIES: FixH family protein [Aneurinibacillus]AMA73365.1 hypothetical protein ACH33_11210 [Aneurinibacillus sp. XH2]MED0676025.1 FixH family protein [Aneurinibacillus thermoaerophilus]MED0680571.1 FixH family protein [Aneurinibacillus thermoaerophilus]MED0736308.1 FixH family protein [Aneurinibacillus thermoaerophilus]MED0758037.1 FixH family protein [Aneurinibacillus thermoaerophilus]